LPEAVPICVPLLKNVIVAVGVAPELPPEESALLLCVSTKAVRVTFAFVAMAVALDVRVVVVGAWRTVKTRGVDALLAL
jgi:hypothetical protein